MMTLSMTLSDPEGHFGYYKTVSLPI